MSAQNTAESPQNLAPAIYAEYMFALNNKSKPKYDIMFFKCKV